MKLTATHPNNKNMRFEIEHDSKAGYYLYVWEGDRNTYDYLQDTLEIAMEQAEEEFGVPTSAWTKIG